MNLKYNFELHVLLFVLLLCAIQGHILDNKQQRFYYNKNSQSSQSRDIGMPVYDIKIRI